MVERGRWSTTRIVLVVVGSVLFVCCSVGGVVGYFGFRGLMAAVGPPRDATEAFVDDLRYGDFGGAYDKLCASTQAQFSRAEFAALVDKRRPSGVSVRSTNVRTMNGDVTATVVGDVSYPDGFKDRHTFELAKENGVWKVCGSPY